MHPASLDQSVVRMKTLQVLGAKPHIMCQEKSECSECADAQSDFQEFCLGAQGDIVRAHCPP